MELQAIVDRYAEGLAAVDASTQVVNVNRRTHKPYLPGLPSLTETQVVDAVDDWWAHEYPRDFAPPFNRHFVNFQYSGAPSAKCDHVFTTDGDPGAPEWAIEVKKPALIGANGKRNDFAVTKVLSPYLKDRGLLHDVLRLRARGLGRRRAVLGFSFNYDNATCHMARVKHPGSLAEIEEIERVVAGNDQQLSIGPLIDFCDGILHVRGVVSGPMRTSAFEAWRSPCGGTGVVYAWEVNDQPGPKHPW